jgi:hypothetical protein
MHHQENPGVPRPLRPEPGGARRRLAAAAPRRASAQPGEPRRACEASPQAARGHPAATRDQLPTFVEGDRISGRTDLETTVIEGNAVLRRGDTVIRADKLEYNQPDDLAGPPATSHQQGRQRLRRPAAGAEGRRLPGLLQRAALPLPAQRRLRRGRPRRLHRRQALDHPQRQLHHLQAQAGPELDAGLDPARRLISLDQEEETGYAEGAVLSFKGVPILPVPAMSFPLGDKRKSGLLPPTIGLDNKNGLELTLPYYWNIAPNRDATLYPTLMTKRGIDLGGEFRYLEPATTASCAATTCPTTGCATAIAGATATSTCKPSAGLPCRLRRRRAQPEHEPRQRRRLLARLLAHSSSLTQRLLPTTASCPGAWAISPSWRGC